MKLMEAKYTLNDLPLYNPWIKRLLGFEEIRSVIKNKKELEREYEKEKWGRLLNKLVTDKIECSIENVDSAAFEESDIIFGFYKDEFIKCSYGEMHGKYLNMVYDAISK